MSNTEKALMDIAVELPRLTKELEKLNKTFGVPTEMKNNLVTTLNNFKRDMHNALKSQRAKSVQE